MLVQLPNGLIDGADHFNFVEIGELLGRHQNYLADKELVVGNIGHVEKLVAELIESIQTQSGLKWKGDKKQLPWLLTTTDIETILIKIRENTYGDRFYFNAYCDHCDHLNKDIKISLESLKVTPISIEEMVKPKITMLPKKQVEAELKDIYLKDQLKIIELSKGKGDKLITSVVAVTLKRIGDNTNITEELIGDIPVKDILHIQKFMEDMPEGSIDTEIEHGCSGCKKDFTVKLNAFDPGFFDPSKDTPT